MSEKFCPAGGIECDNFQPPIYCKGIVLENILGNEVCYWPSRQQPVDKQAVNETESEHFLKGYNRGYLAGAAEQLKREGEAGCDRADDIGGEYGDVLRDQAIAAITALKK